MPAETRAENYRKLFEYVTKYGATFGGTSFVKEMLKIPTSSKRLVLGDVHARKRVREISCGREGDCRNRGGRRKPVARRKGEGRE